MGIFSQALSQEVPVLYWSQRFSSNLSTVPFQILIYPISSLLYRISYSRGQLIFFVFKFYFSYLFLYNIQVMKNQKQLLLCITLSLLFAITSMQTCPIDNCQSCFETDSDAFCDKCGADKIPSNDEKSCVDVACILADNGLCQCPPSHVYASGTCSVCTVTNCILCQIGDDAKCEQCNNGYALNPTSGICQKCTKSYCKSCASGALSTCTQCYEGFKQESGSCTIQPCSNSFQKFNGKQCACPHRQYSTGTACANCPSGCAMCASDIVCNKCLPEYFMDGTLCSECIANCEQCTTTSDCIKCINGFALIEGICQSVPSELDGGIVVYTKDSTQKYAHCREGCRVCSRPMTCTHCQVGFYLQMGDCKACSPTCKTCLIHQPEYCLSCYGGHFLENTKCILCNQANCMHCHQKDYCAKCDLGYYAQNGQCKMCLEYCLDCDNAGTCNKCQPGYTFISSAGCIQCLQGCKTCSNTDISSCTSCFDDHYKNSTNFCNPCPVGCSRCTEETSCSACYRGFSLHSDSLCHKTCQFPCKECSSQDQSSCTSCFAGYSLNGNVCDPVLCTSNCNVCPMEYALSDQICKACSATDSNCDQCQTDDQSKCRSCSQGFYLDDQTCATCPAQCSSCLNGGFCTECQPTHYLQIFDHSLTGQCKPCSEKHQCATCYKHPTWCTSCNEGFWRWGRRCLSIHFIDYQFTFPVTLNRVGETMRYTKTTFSQLLGIDRVHVLYHTMKYDSETGLAELSLYIDENPDQKLTQLTKTLQEQLKVNIIENLVFNYVRAYHTNNCGILNCMTCDYFENAVFCDRCVQGFDPNDQKTQCTFKCADGDPNTEMNCKCPPTLVNEDGFCKFCAVDDCVLCEIGDSNSCDICQNGYDLVNGKCNPKCVVESLSPCKCTEYEVQVAGQCKTCAVADCLLCKNGDISTCDICRDGFLYQNDGKVCTKCSVQNCKRCDQANPSECLTCFDGFIRTSSTKQCNVPSNCPNTQYFNGQQCVCPQMSFFSGLRDQCVPCPPNCEKCSTFSCDQCFPGYFSDLQNDRLCSKCKNHCKRCSTANKCSECFDGFALLQGQSGPCTPLATGIASVVQYTRPGSSTSSVASCPGVCQSCLSPTECQHCPPGFLRVKGLCKQCSLNCKTCLEYDNKYCLSCFQGHSLEGGICFKCPEKCLSCISKTFCKRCMNGFYPNNGICEACPSGCATCNTGINGCLTCEPGFTLIGQNCVQCILGCSVCSNQNINTCITCHSDFYDDAGICKNCPEGCLSCKKNNDKVQCQSCKAGYILDSTRKICVINCIFPCLTCSLLEPTSCGSCFAGYKLEGSSCIGDLDCNSGSNCIVCPNTHAVVSGKCQQCSIVDRCATCYPGDVTMCSSCIEGYYLQDSKCAQCSQKCKNCVAEQFCSECSDGFYLEHIGGQSTGQCLTCESQYDCKTCIDSYTKCTSCRSGYTLRSQKCLRNNFVVIIFTFTEATFASTTAKIFGGKKALQGTTKLNIAKITILKMILGSVVVTTQFSSTDDVTPLQIKNTVEETYKAGDKIGELQLVNAPAIQITIDDCQVKNCAECVDSKDKCKTCNDNYKLTDAFQCEQIGCQVDNCNTCVNQNPLKCSVCSSGYSLNDDGNCEIPSNLGLILGLSIPLGCIALLILFLAIRKSSKDDKQEQYQVESSQSIGSGSAEL